MTNETAVESNLHYQRIDGTLYRKIYVVGDLHGCYQSLLALMHKVQFDKSQDLIVSVGDLIDRGNDSIGCLRLQREAWFKPVLGNHEAMALEVVRDEINALRWYHNGGDWYWDMMDGDDTTLKAEVNQLILDVSKLPYVIEVVLEDRKVAIVHADYPSNDYVFGKPLPTESFIWSRDRFTLISEDQKRTVPTYTDFSVLGIDAVYFGHTPVKEVLRAGNLNYIDTGAVFGGHLSLICIKG